MLSRHAGYNQIQKGANYTAVAWDWIQATNTMTITLPDTPPAGAQVAIASLGGTVTLNRGGSNAIQVPLGASVTTITIPINRNIELIFDGSQWFAIGNWPLQWISVTFGTDWTNYDAVNYNSVSYSRDATGIVRIRGAATKGTAITLGSTIFTLPAIYRPPKITWFPVEAEFGVGNRAAFLIEITAAAGTVSIFDNAGNAPSGGGFPGTYVMLDHITFDSV